MNTELINPFLSSLSHVLTTMATLKVVRGKANINLENADLGDVSANIDMHSTQLDVSLMMSFTKDAILDIYTRMLGEEVENINGEVQSLVGEITNMVIGSAKQQLDTIGFDFNMSIPTVSTDVHHLVNHHHEAIIFIPYNTAKGHIYLQLQFIIKPTKPPLTH